MDTDTYYNRNRDKMLQYARERYLQNKQQIVEYNRNYYLQHKEELYKKSKVTSKKWREENRIKLNEYKRNWYARKHKEKKEEQAQAKPKACNKEEQIVVSIKSGTLVWD
jgi:alpha-galactosidase/6-phospho-beta-glucosidase family protein